MGEVLGYVLFVLVIIGAFAFLGVNALSASTRKRVVASAPPSAQINEDDNLQTALAKSRNHHRVIEAVRIFNELQHQDTQLAIFDDKTKRDVQAFLNDYYKDN